MTDDDDLSDLIPTEITVDDETFEWLLAELERPLVLNEKLAKLLRMTKGTVKHV